MGLILLDTTVIVGFLDRDDALHDTAVASLRAAGAKSAFAASAVSYAEVMTGIALEHHPEDAVSGFFADLIRELLPVDRAVAARAGALRGARRSLRMPDALILATADLNEQVDTVVCADSDWVKLEDLSCRIELLRPSVTAEPHADRRSVSSPAR